jgi:hypothetical protein
MTSVVQRGTRSRFRGGLGLDIPDNRTIAGVALVSQSWVAAMSIAALALIASLLVVFDPLLAGFVPTDWWLRVQAEDWPVRITPVVLIGLAALAIVIRSAPAYLTVLIASLQMNGLRLGPVDPVDLVVLVGFAGLAARTVNRPDRHLRVGIVGNAALVLVLIALPHLIAQGNIVRFGIGWVGLIRSFLIALVVINLIDTREQFRNAIKIFVLVAVLSASLGILQFAASFVFQLHFTLIDPPDAAFKPTPIGIVMRSSGLCITAQHQSGFLLLALPFAVWKASTSWKFIDLAATALIAVGILVTWNMGGILVGAVGGSAIILFRWPRHAIQIVVTALLAATLLYYFGVVEWLYDQIFNAGVVKGVSQRNTLSAIGFEKLDRNVLVGTGPQGFANFSGNFWKRPVHNTYLQIATELGSVAAVIFAATLLAVTTGLVLTWLRAGNVYDRAMLSCLVVAQGSFMSIIMSEPMMDHSNTWFYLAIAQAALFVFNKRLPEEATQERRRPRPWRKWPAMLRAPTASHGSEGPRD